MKLSRFSRPVIVDRGKCLVSNVYCVAAIWNNLDKCQDYGAFMKMCVTIDSVIAFIANLFEVRHIGECNLIFTTAVNDAYFEVCATDGNTRSRGDQGHTASEL